MNDDEQMRVLVEIRDLLRQQAETQKAEAAANAEHRAWAKNSQDHAQGNFREAVATHKTSMRIWMVFIVIIAVLGFFAVAQELKSTIKDTVSPKVDPVEQVRRLLQPPNQTPDSDSP